jgi:hypothetical protein
MNITSFPLELEITGDGVSLTNTTQLASTPTSASIAYAFAQNGTDQSGNVSVAIVGSSLVFSFIAPFTGPVVVGVNLASGFLSALPAQSVVQATTPWVTKSTQQPVFTSIVVANPPLGTAATIVVPAGVQWSVKTVFFWLQTSATVANRIAVVTAITAPQGSPPTTVALGAAYSQFTQAANIVNFYTFSNAFASATANFAFVNEIQVSMPNFVLPPSASIQLNAGFMQAGDQISHIALGVEATTL